MGVWGLRVLSAGATRLWAGLARHDAVVAHAPATRVRFLGHVVAPFVTLVAGEVLPGLVVLAFSRGFARRLVRRHILRAARPRAVLVRPARCFALDPVVAPRPVPFTACAACRTGRLVVLAGPLAERFSCRGIHNISAEVLALRSWARRLLRRFVARRGPVEAAASAVAL